MKLETRFDVAEEVLVMYQDKIVKAEVQGFYINSGAMDFKDVSESGDKDVNIWSSKIKKGITYKIRIADKELYFPEWKLFKTREELIASL